MKIYLLAICSILILSSSPGSAQVPPTFAKPDFAKIKETISNKETENYYPKLLERLSNNDSLLTDEQYKLLYFGYVFQDSYDPYWTPKYAKTLAEYYRKPTLEKSDCDSIIKYCKLSIADFPFDIQQLKMLGYAYHRMGDKENEKIWYRRFARVIATIMSTGRGLSCENSVSVIVINHEYELLKQFDFRLLRHSSTKDKCDYMELQPNKSNIAGLYFDISIMLDMAYKSKILKR
ncbi:DUF4919 domain-containing protein [uncultured Acetobacteroides sp.]|uniref:DUF4919 domain-containing protein n=1 Tax=uncultured Acetobacteroides sp. TaxID=1760811 RepID=UPI0029F483BF|nr:DUF4919 domain-containing protein [uncultured Acetobacteroides sp.]